MKLNKPDKGPVKVGILAGFVASLCCLGPLVLITLGIGGASSALAIGQKKPYFLALAILIFVAGLTFYYFDKSKRDCQACQTQPTSRRQAVMIIVLAAVSFITVYYFLIKILVPYLAPLVYQNFYNKGSL